MNTVRELFLSRYAPLHQLCPKTIILYGHTLDRFSEFLEHEPQLVDLDDLVVSRFLQWRASTERRGKLPSISSVLKDRVQLVAIWTYLARKKLVAEFPELPPMRAPQRTPRAYTSSDVARLITAGRLRTGLIGTLPEGWWWHTLLYAAWCTAERIGALLALRWDQVDLDGRTITFLAETRKGHTRDIERAITQDLADALRMQQRGPRDLVWPWPYGITLLWPTLKKIARKAGVTPRGFHGIRKSAASYFALAGGSAQQLLDHEKASTTQRSYIDVRIVGTGPTAPDLLPRLDLG